MDGKRYMKNFLITLAICVVGVIPFAIAENTRSGMIVPAFWFLAACSIIALGTGIILGIKHGDNDNAEMAYIFSNPMNYMFIASLILGSQIF